MMRESWNRKHPKRVAYAEQLQTRAISGVAYRVHQRQGQPVRQEAGGTPPIGTHHTGSPPSSALHISHVEGIPSSGVVPRRLAE